MVGKILIISLFILLNSCDYIKKFEGRKDKYYSTMKRCELFIEFYLVINSKGWGVDNTYGLYLTDSTNFRIYLGHMSDHGEQEIFCKNDSIFIVIDNYYDIELPSNEAYSISKLKELKNIDNINLETE